MLVCFSIADYSFSGQDSCLFPIAIESLEMHRSSIIDTWFAPMIHKNFEMSSSKSTPADGTNKTGKWSLPQGWVSEKDSKSRGQIPTDWVFQNLQSWRCIYSLTRTDLVDVFSFLLFTSYRCICFVSCNFLSLPLVKIFIASNAHHYLLIWNYTLSKHVLYNTKLIKYITDHYPITSELKINNLHYPISFSFFRWDTFHLRWD